MPVYFDYNDFFIALAPARKFRDDFLFLSYSTFSTLKGDFDVHFDFMAQRPCG